jgi:predicted DNA-binding transcriptional regulator YafY
VQIQYRDELDRRTDRTIWPIGIAYYEATRNIIAWCELRTAFRHFRTDRISHFDILNYRYPKRRKALLKEWQEELRAEQEKPDLDVFL